MSFDRISQTQISKTYHFEGDVDSSYMCKAANEKEKCTIFGSPGGIGNCRIEKNGKFEF